MEGPISTGSVVTIYDVDRRRRVRAVAIVIPALLGGLLWLWLVGQEVDYFYKTMFPRDFYVTIAIALFGISSLALIMTYLQTGFKRSAEFELESARARRDADLAESKERDQLASLTQSLRADLDRTRAEIDRALSLASNVGETDREALVNDLKGQIRAEAGVALLSEIKAEIESARNKDFRDKELFFGFEELRARISRELEALSWRGNLNLGLGAITTVIGLSLLGMSVFQEVSTSRNVWDIATHFIPRLTLVLMIELFAYFFLALYKSNLQEIKYFQNELTNVELKQIALRAALDTGDTTIVESMVVSLAATERNHVLSKDQTTVELEKAKIERSGQSEIVKYLSEILQKKV